MGWQPFLDDEVSAGARYDIDRQRCPPSGFLRPLQHQALQRAVRVLHMTMPAPAITPRCSTAQRRRRRRRSAGQHWPVTQRHPPSRQHRNVIHTVEVERTFYVDEMVDHRVREAALQAAHDPGRVFQSSAEPIHRPAGARLQLAAHCGRLDGPPITDTGRGKRTRRNHLQHSLTRHAEGSGSLGDSEQGRDGFPPLTLVAQFLGHHCDHGTGEAGAPGPERERRWWPARGTRPEVY